MSILGYHWVKTAYGQWLPGDQRGHWSSVWNPQKGYHARHQLHQGDATRQQIAVNRMKFGAVTFSRPMMICIRDAIRECAKRSDWQIVAMTIQPTHVHLLMTPTHRDIERTVAWLADQTTKAVHRETSHQGPLWGRGKWLQYIEHEQHWHRLVAYIHDHPTYLNG